MKFPFIKLLDFQISVHNYYYNSLFWILIGLINFTVIILARNIIKLYGWSTVFTGADAAVCSQLTNCLVSMNVSAVKKNIHFSFYFSYDWTLWN